MSSDGLTHTQRAEIDDELEARRLGTIPKALEERVKRGRWVPASGGTEEPYKTRSGIRVLYCWHTGTGDHAWLNVDTDIIMTPEEADAAHGWRH